VVDADTISVRGQQYRLIGFDAPETGLIAKCHVDAGTGCAMRVLKLSRRLREPNRRAVIILLNSGSRSCCPAARLIERRRTVLLRQ
jgi:hypothetical protein